MGDKQTEGEKIASEWFEAGISHHELRKQIDSAISKAVAEERKRAGGLTGALEIISCTQRFAQDKVILGQMMRAPDADDCRRIVREALATYNQSGEAKGE